MRKWYAKGVAKVLDEVLETISFAATAACMLAY
jgi:hypothetical protein